jgi:hypothetical protein
MAATGAASGVEAVERGAAMDTRTSDASGSGGGGGGVARSSSSSRRNGSVVGREHAVEFARAVFNASIAANGANGTDNGAEGNTDTDTVTEESILQYFEAHKEERYHLLGPSFTWDAFFNGIHADVHTNEDRKDGKDRKDRRFDVNRFITAIVKVRRKNNEDGEGSNS